jgi:hypothetical protein
MEVKSVFENIRKMLQNRGFKKILTLSVLLADFRIISYFDAFGIWGPYSGAVYQLSY